MTIIEFHSKFSTEFDRLRREMYEIASEVRGPNRYTVRCIIGGINKKKRFVRETILYIMDRELMRSRHASGEPIYLADGVFPELPLIVVPGMNNFPREFLPVTVNVLDGEFREAVEKRFTAEAYDNRARFTYVDKISPEIVTPRFALTA